MKIKIIICWFIVLFFVLYLSGCGTSKKVKFKSQEETKIEFFETSEVEIRSVENIVSETKEENKIDTILDKVDSWFNFEANEITVTSKDGSIINIKNPKINKGGSNLNQKTKEENKITTRDSTIKKEENNSKSDVQLTLEESKSKLDIDKEKMQFDFRTFALQLFGAGVLIYFCLWIYRKL